jgi:cyclic pyranopterin phosphate synthase
LASGSVWSAPGGAETSRLDLECQASFRIQGKTMIGPTDLIDPFGSKIRITGGEPLARTDLDELIVRIKAIPEIADLSLSPNATRLSVHAEALRVSGVDRLNISLDTLDLERFAKITGRDCLPQVLDGLQVAKGLGCGPVKINMIMMQETTEAKLDQMVDY